MPSESSSKPMCICMHFPAGKIYNHWSEFNNVPFFKKYWKDIVKAIMVTSDLICLCQFLHIFLPLCRANNWSTFSCSKTFYALVPHPFSMFLWSATCFETTSYFTFSVPYHSLRFIAIFLLRQPSLVSRPNKSIFITVFVITLIKELAE